MQMWQKSERWYSNDWRHAKHYMVNYLMECLFKKLSTRQGDFQF